MELHVMIPVWGVVGAGMVALIKLGRCPCPWWKLAVAFLGGGGGGLIFHHLAQFKVPYSGIEFLASFVPVAAVAALAYCIVCPFPPPPPIDRD